MTAEGQDSPLPGQADEAGEDNETEVPSTPQPDEESEIVKENEIKSPIVPNSDSYNPPPPPVQTGLYNQPPVQYGQPTVLGQQVQIAQHQVIGVNAVQGQIIQTNQPNFGTIPTNQNLVAPAVIAAVPHPILGPDPVQMKCPNCTKTILTVTSQKVGSGSIVLGIILCSIGCFCCACLPCLMKSMKDTLHKCPNCSAYLGTYNPVTFSPGTGAGAGRGRRRRGGYRGRRRRR